MDEPGRPWQRCTEWGVGQRNDQWTLSIPSFRSTAPGNKWPQHSAGVEQTERRDVSEETDLWNLCPLVDKSWCGFKKMLTGSHERGTELANTQKPLQSCKMPQKQTWAQRVFGTTPSTPGHSWGEDSRLCSLSLWLFFYINISLTNTSYHLLWSLCSCSSISVCSHHLFICLIKNTDLTSYSHYSLQWI